MMWFLVTILVLIVLYKLAGFFNGLASTFQKEKDEEAEYRQALLDSVQDLKVTEKKDPTVDQQEALFRANKELLEKNKLKEAMKEELGID